MFLNHLWDQLVLIRRWRVWNNTYGVVSETRHLESHIDSVLESETYSHRQVVRLDFDILVLNAYDNYVLGDSKSRQHWSSQLQCPILRPAGHALRAVL